MIKKPFRSSTRDALRSVSQPTPRSDSDATSESSVRSSSLPSPKKKTLLPRLGNAARRSSSFLPISRPSTVDSVDSDTNSITSVQSSSLPKKSILSRVGNVMRQSSTSSLLISRPETPDDDANSVASAKSSTGSLAKKKSIISRVGNVIRQPSILVIPSSRRARSDSDTSSLISTEQVDTGMLAVPLAEPEALSPIQESPAVESPLSSEQIGPALTNPGLTDSPRSVAQNVPAESAPDDTVPENIETAHISATPLAVASSGASLDDLERAANQNIQRPEGSPQDVESQLAPAVKVHVYEEQKTITGAFPIAHEDISLEGSSVKGTQVDSPPVLPQIPDGDGQLTLKRSAGSSLPTAVNGHELSAPSDPQASELQKNEDNRQVDAALPESEAVLPVKPHSLGDQPGPTSGSLLCSDTPTPDISSSSAPSAISESVIVDVSAEGPAIQRTAQPLLSQILEANQPAPPNSDRRAEGDRQEIPLPAYPQPSAQAGKTYLVPGMMVQGEGGSNPLMGQGNGNANCKALGGRLDGGKVQVTRVIRENGRPLPPVESYSNWIVVTIVNWVLAVKALLR